MNGVDEALCIDSESTLISLPITAGSHRPLPLFRFYFLFSFFVILNVATRMALNET